ncbi:hypothetical protein [Streptomyces rochei]|uniref:hypothetical protein n=1 Tax=Streptomyces rochei TaxID=1928 RepID=UPI00362F0AC6
MDESTGTAPPKGTPTEGFCSWHDRISEDVRLIRLDSGDTHYACVHCIRIYKLTPYEDQ